MSGLIQGTPSQRKELHTIQMGAMSMLLNTGKRAGFQSFHIISGYGTSWVCWVQGPILWTELAKCEAKKATQISVQTLRTCMRIYLAEELKLVPQNWPIIAAGAEAYKALAYRFADHIVLGVPHPTGSHGQFTKLINDKEMLTLMKSSLKQFLDGNREKAGWVNADKSILV